MEQTQHLIMEEKHWKMAPGERSRAGPAAKLCLLKLLELWDLAGQAAMCSTASWSEEAVFPRPGGWMPHFSLMAQPSLQVVEGMEKNPASLEETLTGAAASQETCRPLPHLSSLLCTILEEAASPGGFWELSHKWRSESSTICSICFLLQDYIFYLEPEKLESGKGKCSYDPKVDTVSALISESRGSLVPVLPALGRGSMQVGWNNCSHQEQGSCSATPACFSWPGTWPSRGGDRGCRPVPASRTLWDGHRQWLLVVWRLPTRSGAGN